ncbi:hypothetical protein GCM10009430_40100 [Aquimarina litoralis]|uniref:Class I SAM-dependent methyltransferase n=1 Tax=Aquimarina litoralis TaxID=584605 RepID=A0ABN1J5V4_9FLAO
MITKVIRKLQNAKIKTIDDDFIKRLRCSVIGEGMLHEGNIYLIDKAIKNMPNNGCVLEIGSYGGLSTNLILYLLQKNNKHHKMVGCDAWIYEGFNDHKNVDKNDYIDGRTDISRKTYMDYIKNSFINTTIFFNKDQLPHTCNLLSDVFFEKWFTDDLLVDVFGREFHLNDKIAFCYIDGDHSYEQTKSDFHNTDKLLLKGGYILIDDSARHLHYGSSKFIKYIKTLTNYRIINSNPNFLIQKIK